jgi:hypothetical protein
MKTIAAIKKKYRTVSAFCIAHNFNNSLVNDLLHKRAHYANNYPVRSTSKAYQVLQVIIEIGCKNALIADGIDISYVDTKKITTLETIYVQPKYDTTDLDFMMLKVYELGDEYCCKVFSSTNEAGPRALLFMLEMNPVITKRTLQFLRHSFVKSTFTMQSNCVITVD